MTVGVVVQVLVSGLAAGAVYGLVAIGFSLIWQLTRVLHLAYGSIVGGSMFVTLLVAAGTAPVTASNVGAFRSLFAMAVALIAGAAAGALMYLVVLRPFVRRGTTLGWIGASVAVALAIEGTLSASFPRSAYVLPDPLPFSRWRPLSLGGGATLPPRTLWVLAAGSLLAACAGYVLTRTRFGRAVTAVASEPMGAQIVGLPIDRLVTLAFALTGALAVAAAIVGTAGSAVSTDSGLLLGLKAIAAAMLAGLGAPGRVYRAALLLGVFEAAIVGLHVPGVPRLALGPAWRDIGPIALALVVIAVRATPLLREPVE